MLNLSNAFEFFNLDFNWTPAYLGTHDIMCVADVNNEIAESNEENNNMSVAIDVLPVPTPDFTVTNISEIILSETCLISDSLLSGGNNNVYINIENLAEPPYLGIGDVNISLRVFDKNNNLVYNNTKTRNLTNVWKIININFNWTPLSEGNYTLTAVIDSDSKINETNEFNNNFTAVRSVKYNNSCVTKNLVTGNGTCHFLKLDLGWNLISLPLKPDNNSINSVLGGIQGKWTDVSIYDNVWAYKSYYLGGWFGNLSTMDAGRGYWLWVNESVNLQVYGEQVPLNISLHSGWNMIGVTHALNVSELDLDYDKLVAHDPDLRVSYRMNYKGVWFSRNLDEMVPGKGYWIHMLKDEVLEV